MIEHGDKAKPFAHLSVQFATPCYDGAYCREYVKSFHNTVCVLIEMGARVDWAEFPGCADLALARAKIFGNFLRSNHTHLMMIDADMGWDPADVCRLLLLERGFVGAAGPKKSSPVAFAANNCDDEGNILPVKVEIQSGLVHCTEVGAAFMLMSRSCAQRVADAYPELAFPGDNGVTEYAVYDPFMVGSADKRRRLSEDFAFCHRWRRIGGEIALLPDVHMTHTGTAVWDGAFINELMCRAAPASEKAADIAA